jgi:cation diffusion facilitator CzcD-associated flavoprotein CzcO
LTTTQETPHAEAVGEHVAIVGAGPAGLAAAGELRRVGVDALVVERTHDVAAAWRTRHDHLHLNTHRALSHQPGMRIPRSCGPYPSRDDYVAYLERYASQLRIRFDTSVSRIDRSPAGWRLSLPDHASVTATHVVVATGPDAVAVVPSWPGLSSYTGNFYHAGEFRNVSDVAGKDVLVVGAGNSGVDLLNHLVGSSAGQLWLSARSGTNIAPRRFGGVPTHLSAVAGKRLPTHTQDNLLRTMQTFAFGDLTRYGLHRAKQGAFSRAISDGVTVAVDDGFVAALKRGRVCMKPAIVSFDGPRVAFEDGTVCTPTVVICATGYRPDLAYLVGHLVDLDAAGMPPFVGATASREQPGLWFFGLDRSIYGNMFIRRGQARGLARLIAGRPHPGVR